MKIVCVILMLFFRTDSFGQNNQIKLYIQQIAANKVYIEYLQKGYSIVRSGLKTIGDIKDGHFKLDEIFFKDLERINPKISNYAKVADIVMLNGQVVKRAAVLVKGVKGSPVFHEREIKHIGKVLDALTDDCAELMDELNSLLRASAFKMSDDERLKRINALNTQMRSNYAFLNNFSGELRMLEVQKLKEQNEGSVVEDLIKN